MHVWSCVSFIWLIVNNTTTSLLFNTYSWLCNQCNIKKVLLKKTEITTVESLHSEIMFTVRFWTQVRNMQYCSKFDCGYCIQVWCQYTVEKLIMSCTQLIYLLWKLRLIIAFFAVRYIDMAGYSKALSAL